MIRLSAAFLILSSALLRADAPAMRLMDEGVRTFESAVVSWDCDGFKHSADLFTRATKAGAATGDARYWLGVTQFHRMLCLLHPHSGPAANGAAEEAMLSAIDALELPIKTDPTHAEAHALLGTLLGMKIQGGLFRAILYGPRIAKHQSQALKHGASNPRVRYLNGTGLLHTAKDADALRKALKELRTAETLFDAEAQKPARGHDPRWGAASCQQFIGRTLERLGRPKEAIAAYRKALTLQPSDHESASALRRLNPSP
jgi:tetratricopeptide (TPR) repeat protein